VVTRTDYNQRGVKAAYSVMLEIIRILGEYKGNMVLIGGWVPQLLFQNTGELHIGSIDVDLAFDHKRITDDAYDIYYCLKQYEDRLDELVDEFRPHLENGLIQEGLHKLAKNFETEEHTGPKFVADFEEITDEEDRAQIQRDAFERTNYLLRELGVV